MRKIRDVFRDSPVIHSDKYFSNYIFILDKSILKKRQLKFFNGIEQQNDKINKALSTVKKSDIIKQFKPEEVIDNEFFVCDGYGISAKFYNFITDLNCIVAICSDNKLKPLFIYRWNGQQYIYKGVIAAVKINYINNSIGYDEYLQQQEKERREKAELKEKQKKTKLLKPLFVNGNFNKDGKRIRVRHLKTVGDYNLYVDAGKPDKSYARNELDRYYIYIQLNNYVFSYGETEFDMINKTGNNKMVKELYGNMQNRRLYFENIRKSKSQEEANTQIAEQLNKEEELISKYGKEEKAWEELIKNRIDANIKKWIEARDNNGGFADFIGALAINELEKCRQVAKILWKKREEEYEKRRKEVEKKEKKAEEERIKRENELIDEAKNILINGGTIKDARSIVSLADRYDINIPLRTRGWMLNMLTEVDVSELGSISYRYLKKSKYSKGSQKVFDVLYKLVTKIKNGS